MGSETPCPSPRVLLQRRLLDHLDDARSNLGLFEEDPRAAAMQARIAIEQAEAVLILLRHLDAGRARDQRTSLRAAWRLLGPVIDHRSRLRPDAPPPLAPAARSWVREATAHLTTVRLQLDLPQWHAPADLSAIRSDAVATYTKARKRWNRKRLHQTRTARQPGPSAKMLRAARRMRFQAEALCPPERLATAARYRSIVTSDLARWFSLTPAEHGRWLDARTDLPGHVGGDGHVGVNGQVHAG